MWKTQQWPQDWKRSVFIPIPKKGNAKDCSNYCTIALISHASKVMLKILQARLQQYMNRELPDAQAHFRKGRGTRDKVPTSAGSPKKQESSRKTSISALLTYAKAFDCVDHSKVWKILKDMGIPDYLGEGNGNPLQCSFLENSRDGGAWWAGIYGVTQSQTRLK